MPADHRYRVFAICAIGVFLSVSDTSAAIVALPTIAGELGTGLPAVQWVIVGSSVTIAALLVPMGRLADLVGRKRVHVLGCCLFTCGGVAAALAGSVGALILARVLLGAGAAMTQGTAMAIVAGHFGPGERAKMLGLQTGAVGLGAIAGPALGGLVVDALGWRQLFALTAAAMLVVAISAQRVLQARPRKREADAPPFDTTGAVLFSSLLVVALLTLTLGPERGWRGAAALSGAAAFAVLLVAFVRVERRHPAPMLDLALFRNGTFALGSLGILIAFMGLSSMRFLAPFFLQGVKGFEPARVGLLLAPAAVVTALVSPLAGRFADRFGVRLFACLGFAIAIAGLAVFTRLKLETPTWAVVAGLMVIAFGMATFSAPNSASVLNSVDEGTHGVAAAFINLSRNVGNVVGIAFSTAVVTLTMTAAGYPPSLSAVDRSAGLGVSTAFTSGVSVACAVLVAIAAPLLVLLALNAWGARRGRL